MRKTYRIKHKGRFITFVTLIILLISFAIGALFPVNAFSDISGGAYFEICVKDGDTLWAYAKEYGDPNKDIREIIHDICSINNINSSELQSGMYILIPKY